MLESAGILLGIVLLVYGAMKGVNIVVIAPISALVIIFTNGMDVNEAFFFGKTSYMMGLTGFVKSFFIVFLLGAVLGKYLEVSKATVTIAYNIFKLTGKENAYAVLVALTLISAILTYGGVSLFIVIFTIVVLARPILKAIDLPWHLVMIPLMLGAVSFTMTMMPGTPSIQNVIPTQLGTTLTAAPLMSIIATLVCITYGLIYMRWALNRSLAAGEHYQAEPEEKVAKNPEVEKLPSLIQSVAPMVLLIVCIFVGSFLHIPNVIIPALIISILAAALGLHRYIPSHLSALNEGAVNSILPVIFTAAAVGVGTVVVSSPGFHNIEGTLQMVPGGSLAQITLYTGFLSMVTASSSGALGIVIPMFGQEWIASGVDPEVIHRISCVASSAFSAMPQSGFIFSCMAVFGLTHWQVYKQVFFICMIGGFLALAASLLTYAVFY